MDVFGAGLDPPGGQRVGEQARLEPVGEGLWGGEVVEGHDGDFEKAARGGREMKKWGFGEEGSSGGGGREEETEGEGREEEIG